MSKSIKIILLFLVVAGVVSAGVYFGTRNTGMAIPAPEGEETTLPIGQFEGDTTGSLPTETNTSSTNGGILIGEKLGEVVEVLGARILYKDPVLGFTLAPDGQIILVDRKGLIVSVSASGDKKELNNSEIDNPLEVVFSSDAKKILLTYGKNTAPQFSVYDVASSTWQPILANTVATIRPGTHEVIYLYEKTGVKNLFVWDLDKPKSTPQQISSLQIEDPLISWKDKNTLLINERPSAYTKGTLLAFDLSKKTVEPIIKDRHALHSIWNASGTIGLAFYGDNTYRGGTLRLYGKDGSDGSKLSLLTLPEKCSFLNEKSLLVSETTTTTALDGPKNELYCAIPKNSQTFKLAIMPDDYFRGITTTNDDLVRINLDSGSLNAVFSPSDSQIEMYKLFAGEKEIYFLNRNNDALYSVPNR